MNSSSNADLKEKLSCTKAEAREHFHLFVTHEHDKGLELNRLQEELFTKNEQFSQYEINEISFEENLDILNDNLEKLKIIDSAEYRKS
ncbi:hypothetical protein TorRG33x02_011020 [Trema orientale]|uniref:Uncharacterized protein n=1 Tax=Trema orientale TaxID=63057 RepID=A0A2P5FZ28_TREOI|nr:hypothetical protein TorRG33x02_011020 [Trema orientale]